MRREQANKLYETIDDRDELLIKDEEFAGIVKDYIYGDVYQHGSLEMKLRELVVIVANVTNHTLAPVRRHVVAAIKSGVSPYAIKEAIYQCTPYIGVGKVRDALDVMYQVFDEYQVGELTSAKTVTEDTRRQAGFEVQSEAFGREHIQAGYDNAPEELIHIQYYLSEYCFGDFYTRKGLSLPERELITMIMLATLGGCEPQLTGHVGANIRVGNTRDMLIEAITQIQPYIGFPRTLNAINIINQVTLKK